MTRMGNLLTYHGNTIPTPINTQPGSTEFDSPDSYQPYYSSLFLYSSTIDGNGSGNLDDVLSNGFGGVNAGGSTGGDGNGVGNGKKTNNLVNLYNVNNPSSPLNLAQVTSVLNSFLNGYGVRITDNGINYTSLDYLGQTKNVSPISTTENTPSQLNFRVNWNFISFSDLASDAWNSYQARLLVADMYSLNLGANFAIVYGGGLQASAHLLTRGPNAGIYLTYSTSTRWGVEANVGATISSAWYTGPANEISIDSFLGNGVDLSISYEVTIDIFGSKSNGRFTWIGNSGGEAGLGRINW